MAKPSLPGFPPSDLSLTPGDQWPLDRKPLYYSQQSERFGDMLHMLLKMRGLPPKTCKLSDGILATDTDETARQYFEFIHMDSKVILVTAIITWLMNPLVQAKRSKNGRAPCLIRRTVGAWS